MRYYLVVYPGEENRVTPVKIGGKRVYYRNDEDAWPFVFVDPDTGEVSLPLAGIALRLGWRTATEEDLLTADFGAPGILDIRLNHPSAL
ncbi:hypothetical protein A2368_04770 [Candidatus Collierbacteria bacterium RIFOXYB1_FULL_49_13]|uniref:Uncharacterized protein n=1 Tax=Candidatus Collierbacteria bacterium RIFOXYB1_FULL_49_13 TaxID=1817728 RepID=A0A1F5FFC0_9BACT|nr:MAG: hypothetical protein A2368_04770 [Candidatus Collierbacteria bacterium RIFOXYB1_FULL_49_13]